MDLSLIQTLVMKRDPKPIAVAEAWIPGPVVGSQRARSFGAHRFHTHKHVAYGSDAQHIFAKMKREIGVCDLALVDLAILIETKDKRRWGALINGKPDIDNVEKILWDAATKAGLWLDDNRVVGGKHRRFGVPPGEGGVFVRVRRLSAPAWIPKARRGAAKEVCNG